MAKVVSSALNSRNAEPSFTVPSAAALTEQTISVVGEVLPGLVVASGTLPVARESAQVLNVVASAADIVREERSARGVIHELGSASRFSHGGISTETYTEKSVAERAIDILSYRGPSLYERLERLKTLLANHTEPFSYQDATVFLDRLAGVMGGSFQAFGFRGLVNPQALPASVNACVDRLVADLSANVDQLSPEQLVNFAWGIAHLNKWDVQTMQEIGRLLAPHLGSMHPRLVSNACEAFAVTLVDSPDFRQALCSSFNDILQGAAGPCRGHDLAGIIKCAGMLNYPRQVFENSLATVTQDILPGMRLIDQAVIGWGLAAMQSTLAKPYLQAVVEKLDHREGMPTGLNKHFSCHFIHACLDTGVKLPACYEGMVSRFPSADAEDRQARHRLNVFEGQVFDALEKYQSRGLLISLQSRPMGISVDFELGVPLQSGSGGFRPVVLECDGVRFHYLNSCVADGLSGLDRMRNRILTKHGYLVHRINSEEWFALPKHKRVAFLAERLKLPAPHKPAYTQR